jgi:hypothetical protein
MMGIFGELQTELPEFETYMTWYFKEKECNPIGSSSKAQRVLSVENGTKILSFLMEKQNIQTAELCSILAAGLTSCLILELEDPPGKQIPITSPLQGGGRIVGPKYQMLTKMPA